MKETREECIARIQSMADGDPTWDLSENDRYALQELLHALNDACNENENLGTLIKRAAKKTRKEHRCYGHHIKPIPNGWEIYYRDNHLTSCNTLAQAREFAKLRGNHSPQMESK